MGNDEIAKKRRNLRKCLGQTNAPQNHTRSLDKRPIRWENDVSKRGQRGEQDEGGTIRFAIVQSPSSSRFTLRAARFPILHAWMNVVATRAVRVPTVQKMISCCFTRIYTATNCHNRSMICCALGIENV